MGARGRAKRETWGIEFYATKDAVVPARDFLEGVPDPVEERLNVILDAVCAHPPYAFPPTNMWHVMHGDMKGLHEARDEHDGALYRLFCVLDREASAFGIARPSIILISGGVKPTGRDMAPKIYSAARSYRDDYLRTRRVVP